MRRVLAAVFFLTFAAGALTAALVMRHRTLQPQAHAVVATPAQIALAPDSADDADDAGGDNWPDDADTPEQVVYAQPRMLRDAIARLVPRIVGKPNLYFIGFAGDAEEDVFLNEAEYANTLLGKRFGAAGHELLLVNNPATLSRYPLASLTNLETAIDAVAEKMDRDNDILFLLLTSHGTEDHLLYVNMDPLPLDQIAPEDLADIFAKAKIRYKAIVISACYSGGFIDALKDDSTMIVTAARADRSSFGCGSDSDITDFGRAFFVDGLNHNDTFIGAFAEASKLVNQWETRDHEDHSQPQLVTTPRIEAQLKLWRAGIQLGPPVPFIATRPTSDALTVSR
ncbi:MAG: caspase family protein [Proteobacteria bacterium]|nr:caspase family protein [Pseudomonadota bacterium]